MSKQNWMSFSILRDQYDGKPGGGGGSSMSPEAYALAVSVFGADTVNGYMQSNPEEANRIADQMLQLQNQNNTSAQEMTAYVSANPDSWVNDLNAATNPVQPQNTSAPVLDESETYDFVSPQAPQPTYQPPQNNNSNYTSYVIEDYEPPAYNNPQQPIYNSPQPVYQQPEVIPVAPSLVLTTTHAAAVNLEPVTEYVAPVVVYKEEPEHQDPIYTYDDRSDAGTYNYYTPEETPGVPVNNEVVQPIAGAISTGVAASVGLVQAVAEQIVDANEIADKHNFNDQQRAALERVMAADPNLSSTAVDDFIVGHATDFDIYLDRYDAALSISQTLNLNAADKGLIESAMTTKNELDYQGMIDLIEANPNDWREVLQSLNQPVVAPAAVGVVTASATAVVSSTATAPTAASTAPTGGSGLGITTQRVEWKYEVGLNDFTANMQADQSKWVMTQVQVGGGIYIEQGDSNGYYTDPVFESKLMPPSNEVINALYIQNYGSPLDKTLGRLTSQMDVTTTSGDIKVGNGVTKTERVTVDKTPVGVDPNNRNRDIVWTGNFHDRITNFDANSTINGVSYRDVPPEMVALMDNQTYLARQLSDVAKVAGFSYDNKAGDMAAQLGVYLDTIGVKDATQIFVENDRYIDHSTGRDLGAYNPNDAFAYTAYGDGWTDIKANVQPDGRVILVPAWSDSSDMKTVMLVVAIALAVTGVGAMAGAALLGGAGGAIATSAIGSAVIGTIGATTITGFTVLAGAVGGAVVSAGLTALSGGEVTLGGVAKGAILGGVGSAAGAAFGGLVGATGTGVIDGAIRGAAGGFAGNLIVGESGTDGLIAGAIGGAAGAAASTAVNFANTSLDLNLSAGVQGGLSNALGAVIRGGNTEAIIMAGAQGYGAASGPQNNSQNIPQENLSADQQAFLAVNAEPAAITTVASVGEDGSYTTQFSTKNEIGQTTTHTISYNSDGTIFDSASETISTNSTYSLSGGRPSGTGLNLTGRESTGLAIVSDTSPNMGPSQTSIGEPSALSLTEGQGLNLGLTSPTYNPVLNQAPAFEIQNASTNNVPGFEDADGAARDAAAIAAAQERGSAGALLASYAKPDSVARTSSGATDVQASTAGAVDNTLGMDKKVSTLSVKIDEPYAEQVIARLNPQQQAALTANPEMRQKFIDAIVQEGNSANSTLGSIRETALSTISELQGINAQSLTDLRSTLGVVLGDSTLGQVNASAFKQLEINTVARVAGYASEVELSSDEIKAVLAVTTRAMSLTELDRSHMLGDAKLVQTSLQKTVDDLQTQLDGLTISSGGQANLSEDINQLAVQLSAAKKELQISAVLVQSIDDVNSEMGAIGVKSYVVTRILELNQSGTENRSNAIINTVNTANNQMAVTVNQAMADVRQMTSGFQTDVNVKVEEIRRDVEAKYVEVAGKDQHLTGILLATHNIPNGTSKELTLANGDKVYAAVDRSGNGVAIADARGNLIAAISRDGTYVRMEGRDGSITERIDGEWKDVRTAGEVSRQVDAQRRADSHNANLAASQSAGPGGISAEFGGSEGAKYLTAQDVLDADRRRGHVTNLAVDTAMGVVGLGEAVVGLANLANGVAGIILTGNIGFDGNAVGKALASVGYDPQTTKAMISDFYSDDRKIANMNVQQAIGFANTIVALVENPSVILGSIVQSAPMLLAGAGAVRFAATTMLEAAGIEVGSAAARAFLTNPQVVSRLALIGSGTEGAIVAGNIQEASRQAGIEFRNSILPSLAAGVVTAGFGVGLAKIPGMDDVIALGTAGLGARQGGGSLIGLGASTGMSAVKEGGQEFLQGSSEHTFGNLAQNKQWLDGLGNAAAQSLVVGFAQGGGSHGVHASFGMIQSAPVIPTGPLFAEGTLLPNISPSSSLGAAPATFDPVTRTFTINHNGVTTVLSETGLPVNGSDLTPPGINLGSQTADLIAQQNNNQSGPSANSLIVENYLGASKNLSFWAENVATGNLPNQHVEIVTRNATDSFVSASLDLAVASNLQGARLQTFLTAVKNDAVVFITLNLGSNPDAAASLIQSVNEQIDVVQSQSDRTGSVNVVQALQGPNLAATGTDGGYSSTVNTSQPGPNLQVVPNTSPVTPAGTNNPSTAQQSQNGNQLFDSSRFENFVTLNGILVEDSAANHLNKLQEIVSRLNQVDTKYLVANGQISQDRVMNQIQQLALTMRQLAQSDHGLSVSDMANLREMTADIIDDIARNLLDPDLASIAGKWAGGVNEGTITDEQLGLTQSLANKAMLEYKTEFTTPQGVAQFQKFELAIRGLNNADFLLSNGLLTKGSDVAMRALQEFYKQADRMAFLIDPNSANQDLRSILEDRMNHFSNKHFEGSWLKFAFGKADALYEGATIKDLSSVVNRTIAPNTDYEFLNENRGPHLAERVDLSTAIKAEVLSAQLEQLRATSGDFTNVSRDSILEVLKTIVKPRDGIAEFTTESVNDSIDSIFAQSNRLGLAIQWIPKEIQYLDFFNKALGMFDPNTKTIWLRAGMTESETYSVLTHEFGHAKAFLAGREMNSRQIVVVPQDTAKAKELLGGMNRAGSSYLYDGAYFDEVPRHVESVATNLQNLKRLLFNGQFAPTELMGIMGSINSTLNRQVDLIDMNSQALNQLEGVLRDNGASLGDFYNKQHGVMVIPIKYSIGGVDIDASMKFNIPADSAKNAADLFNAVSALLVSGRLDLSKHATTIDLQIQTRNDIRSTIGYLNKAINEGHVQLVAKESTLSFDAVKTLSIDLSTLFDLTTGKPKAGKFEAADVTTAADLGMNSSDSSLFDAVVDASSQSPILNLSSNDFLALLAGSIRTDQIGFVPSASPSPISTAEQFEFVQKRLDVLVGDRNSSPLERYHVRQELLAIEAQLVRETTANSGGSDLSSLLAKDKKASIRADEIPESIQPLPPIAELDSVADQTQLKKDLDSVQVLVNQMIDSGSSRSELDLLLRRPQGSTENSGLGAVDQSESSPEFSASLNEIANLTLQASKLVEQGQGGNLLASLLEGRSKGPVGASPEGRTMTMEEFVNQRLEEIIERAFSASPAESKRMVEIGQKLEDMGRGRLSPEGIVLQNELDVLITKYSPLSEAEKYRFNGIYEIPKDAVSLSATELKYLADLEQIAHHHVRISAQDVVFFDRIREIYQMVQKNRSDAMSSHIQQLVTMNGTSSFNFVQLPQGVTSSQERVFPKNSPWYKDPMTDNPIDMLKALTEIVRQGPSTAIGHRYFDQAVGFFKSELSTQTGNTIRNTVADNPLAVFFFERMQHYVDYAQISNLNTRNPIPGG